MFIHVLFSVTVVHVAILIKPTFLSSVKYVQYEYAGCRGHMLSWKQRSVIYISFMVHIRPHNCLLFTSYGQSIFTRNVNVPSAMNKVASLFLDLGDLKVSTQLTLPFTVLSQKANGINICIDHLCILFNRLTSFMPSSFGYLVVTQLLPLTSASLFRETRCL